MTNSHSHRGAADAGMVTTPERLSVLLWHDRSDRATRTIRGTSALLRAHAVVEMTDARTGAALAGGRGLRSRPLAVEGPGSASDRLLDAAATARASCIVVGHRSAATPLESTTGSRSRGTPIGLFSSFRAERTRFRPHVLERALVQRP
jgi:hypothetical protein